MSASMLLPMEGGQRVSREPLSVVVLHQDEAARQRARAFYQMMELEFGDDYCFDAVYWPGDALAQNIQAITQDASEADLVLLALGHSRAKPFLDEMNGWLRSVREARHSPFSLVCLTDDPALATPQIHTDLQHLAGHFSMVYLAESLEDNSKKSDRTGISAVNLSPVLFDRLVQVDPHHSGGIND